MIAPIVHDLFVVDSFEQLIGFVVLARRRSEPKHTKRRSINSLVVYFHGVSLDPLPRDHPEIIRTSAKSANVVPYTVNTSLSIELSTP